MEHGDRGFSPIGVVAQDQQGQPAQPEDAALWKEVLELTFPVLADTDGAFYAQWNEPNVLPMAYIIDAQGVVAWNEAGGASGLDEMEEQVLLLLDDE